MHRVQGSADVALLECTNPVRNKWRIRWDVQTDANGSTSYMEEGFSHKPSAEEIRGTVLGWYNEQTTEAILTGFSWNGTPVWLSQENQYNYKAAYDLAVQTSGSTLPVTFKFGTEEKPVYHTFASLDEAADFYTKMVAHIQTALIDGWKKKDAFDVSQYTAD